MKSYHSEKPTFLIYNDWEDIVNTLDSNEQVGELFKALFAFAKRGEQAEFKGALKMAFLIMMKQIQRDGEKWEETCEKNAENGRKGGRPKNRTVNEETEKTERFFEKPNKSHKDKGEDKGEEKEEGEEKDTDAVFLGGYAADTHARADSSTERGEYCNICLTDEEYAKLKEEIPNADDYINRLSEYIASTGRKYNSHFATVRKWYKEDQGKDNANTGSSSSYSTPELTTGRQFELPPDGQCPGGIVYGNEGEDF